jgi:hypothetical protein
MVCSFSGVSLLRYCNPNESIVTYYGYYVTYYGALESNAAGSARHAQLETQPQQAA